jgi:hypothetical protein
MMFNRWACLSSVLRAGEIVPRNLWGYNVSCEHLKGSLCGNNRELCSVDVSYRSLFLRITTEQRHVMGKTRPSGYVTGQSFQIRLRRCAVNLSNRSRKVQITWHKKGGNIRDTAIRCININFFPLYEYALISILCPLEAATKLEPSKYKWNISGCTGEVSVFYPRCSVLNDRCIIAASYEQLNSVSYEIQMILDVRRAGTRSTENVRKIKHQTDPVSNKSRFKKSCSCLN